jgi:glycerophosphoryl diester phosphodiesterase
VGLENPRWPAFVWATALLVAVSVLALLAARGAALAPYAWAHHNRLVAHAMGGIDGEVYTDSIEAWESNYERGYRVFEVDLRVLDDATVVCSHDQPAQSTVDEFKRARVAGRFTPLTVTDLATLMARYPDAWLMTDIKVGRGAPRDSVLRTLRSALDGDATSRSRTIVQAYEEGDWRYAKKLGFENIVYTLYHQKTVELSDAIAFAAENNIRFVAMPKKFVTEDLVRQARRKGIWVGVYTVNSESERSRYERLGVTHFYSDFLRP